MGSPKNHYETLGLNRTAPFEAIRIAYKRLAFKYHPDTSKYSKKIANEKMAEINLAYSVLSDTAKRQDYDLQLASKVPKKTVRSQSKNPSHATKPSYNPKRSQPNSQDSNPKKSDTGISKLYAIISISITLITLLYMLKGCVSKITITN